MKKGTLLVWMLCLVQICLAQKDGNVWYFGMNAGLDFNTTPPTPLTGMLNTQEGCSSIADPVTGELLMYTDGTTVWDRNHNQMPANAGNPLGGSITSTQSALIVPQPGSNTLYYIFTTAVGRSLSYSIVDMSLNAGNGDLVTWNNILLDTVTEKLAAVGNCDRSVFWIVGHRLTSDTFHAFRLTANGIAAAVKSKTGTAQNAYAGYMKFSPDGRRLGMVVAAAPFYNNIELFDFDFNTGKVSNPIADFFSFWPPYHALTSLYGCSFSPDGSKFYASVAFNSPPQVGPRKVYQYDMNAGNAAAIIASRMDIAVQSPDTIRTAAALQLGPDGRLYVVNGLGPSVLGNSIDVINNPNEAGAACNYQPKALYYNTGTASRMGLPNLPESIYAPLQPGPEFDPPQQRALCKGDTAWAPQEPHTFTITPSTGVWINADNTLVGFSPDATTTYTVISSSPCSRNDTTVFTIYVSSGPAAGFVFSPEDLQPSDISLRLINQSSGAKTYQWYDGNGAFLSSTKDHTLPHPGLGTFCYTLVASDSLGCTDTAQRCIDVKDYGSLLIPNTFSPNGDGLNDVFRIYGLYRELLECSVYNRYGERVFHTRDKTKGWDGLYKGKLCDAGTYYYLIRLVDGKGTKLLRKGDINLVF